MSSDRTPRFGPTEPFRGRPDRCTSPRPPKHRHCQRFHEVARLSHHAQGMAWNLAGRSLAASEAGDVRALATAEEAVDAARLGADCACRPRSADWPWPPHCFWRATSSRHRCPDTQDEGVRAGQPLPARWKPRAYELLTCCWVALWRRDEAALAAQRARDSAVRLGAALRPRDGRPRVARPRPEVPGDGETAERCAEAAATAFEGTGAPVDGAISRMLLATALSRGGRAAAAVTELERAAVALAAAGAAGRLAEAERALKQLQPRRTRRSPTGSDPSPPAPTGNEDRQTDERRPDQPGRSPPSLRQSQDRRDPTCTTSSASST